MSNLEKGDFYYHGEYLVFTEQYHLKRGHCCENNCKHCPYKKATIPSVFNWSGGKDSSLALYHILQEQKFAPKLLMTTVNSHFQRVSMHGVRTELLERQAKELHLPLKKIELPEMPSMEDYEKIMERTMSEVKDLGLTHSIFGDIFLEDLKKYREDKLTPAGFEGVFPLWKRNTKELLQEFLDLGFKTILVCIKSELLDKSFAGRIIDTDFIKDLPDNVDPCGENGEFHTFVFDGPIFRNPIPFTIGETVFKDYKNPDSDSNDDNQAEMGFWFTDLILD